MQISKELRQGTP